MALSKDEAIYFLLDEPIALGHLLGFTKLTELHNGWIKDMVCGREDSTLQAHRGSYKTTCVSIALAIILVATPDDKTLFMRKTDSDVKEIVAQVKKIIESKYMQAIVMAIYGCPLMVTVSNANEVSTNLCANDPRGGSQLVAYGINGSLTGKHFDRIFTDDITNIKDRYSKAERDNTKRVYQELQNLKNRDGRIFNTGTPWHKEDASSIMPPAKVYDCYSTGLISEEELAEIKSKMEASLFSANYEMRHIASEDVIFDNPRIGADPSLVEQGTCHLDSAFYGEDYTAFTIVNQHEGTFYVLGKCWRKHVDDVMDQIINIRQSFNAGRIYTELNADKGMIAKELRKRGERTATYTEHTNKYVKITTYLKGAWNDVVFVQGTDEEYIQQVCDYNENAEHDDCPDSLASLLRALWNKKGKDTTQEESNYRYSYLM